MQVTSEAKVKDEMWWRALVPYQKPVLWRSLWQTTNSLGPYFALWYLMYLSLGWSYWITIALTFPAAGFLIRSFIIQHDCGHGAFFKSHKANGYLGSIIGLLTFIPYDYWRHDHAIHHATAGNLDQRFVGDVWTLTVQEYAERSFWKRVGYRIYRNPFVMFGVGSIFMFLIEYRVARGRVGPRERKSVFRMNLAILSLFILIAVTIGLKSYVLIQLPILMVSSSIGVWLFYIQHQYEDVYWERRDDWDYATVAMEGSSFYKLPKVLQWFTGNIGFHHIHHLCPRIPNYSLERCHKENPVFHDIKPVTLLSSLKSLRFRLWDEERRMLVGYGAVKRREENMRGL